MNLEHAGRLPLVEIGMLHGVNDRLPLGLLERQLAAEAGKSDESDSPINMSRRISGERPVT